MLQYYNGGPSWAWLLQVQPSFEGTKTLSDTPENAQWHIFARKPVPLIAMRLRRVPGARSKRRLATARRMHTHAYVCTLINTIIYVYTLHLYTHRFRRPHMNTHSIHTYMFCIHSHIYNILLRTRKHPHNNTYLDTYMRMNAC